ncbi:NAD(P)H-hydrate dehydratase [Pedobacter sandarakinus]|uniref:NAD(P)H-hydrate dehydratase n=1 Tax=Pedobacter sandarakinus TaxID=353156 RepID=UPI0022454299|nr:NAD(P)H-hydrate dehydratase [Pedobacter sandarakinus]MCX2576214.1 NAD(P)H-hydrate dehydratase [Pedobacter sandarakinus]
MQTLLTSSQMRLVDNFTIANMPIASIDLMERAAKAFVKTFLHDEFDTQKTIAIFCGEGNNGGDGLAIAHILLNNGYQNLKVYLVSFTGKASKDYLINLQRIEESKCKKVYLSKFADLKNFKADLIIDAILGSGLNRPLTGEFEKLIGFLNKQHKKIYAVDIPTGFPSEGKTTRDYKGIKAYKTICFQRPKINFYLPESVAATQYFEVVDIGLDESFIERQTSDFSLITAGDISKILEPRKLFSHKGTYGHALIVAGSVNTMGAAILTAMACLYSGSGLTTACIPQSGLTTLNTALPEVMALPRDEYTRIENPAKYQAIAIGPGLGVSQEHERFIESLIATKNSFVIDADALNILANRSDLMSKLPEHTIITPHMKEFDRLFGDHDCWWDRLETAKSEAKSLGITIILKNQFTFICSAAGHIYINPTGNPAMAQGGMGDVLTGIITGLVAQGYSTLNAAILGCFLHGKAGDTLANNAFVVAAGDVAREIPHQMKQFC